MPGNAWGSGVGVGRDAPWSVLWGESRFLQGVDVTKGVQNVRKRHCANGKRA